MKQFIATLLGVFLGAVLASVAGPLVTKYLAEYEYQNSLTRPPDRSWKDDLLGTTLVMPPVAWTFDINDTIELEVLETKRSNPTKYELYAKLDVTGKLKEKLTGVVVMEYVYVGTNWYYSGIRGINLDVTQPKPFAEQIAPPKDKAAEERLEPRFVPHNGAKN